MNNNIIIEILSIVSLFPNFLIFIIFCFVTVTSFSKKYFRIRVHHDKKALNVNLAITIIFTLIINTLFILSFLVLFLSRYMNKSIQTNSLFIRGLVFDIVIMIHINIALALTIDLIRKYNKNRFYYPKGWIFGNALNFFLFTRMWHWMMIHNHHVSTIRTFLKNEIDNIKTIDDIIELFTIIENAEKNWKPNFHKFWYDKVVYDIYVEKNNKITIEDFFKLLSKHQTINKSKNELANS